MKTTNISRGDAGMRGPSASRGALSRGAMDSGSGVGADGGGEIDGDVDTALDASFDSGIGAEDAGDAAGGVAGVVTVEPSGLPG
jgi:hypothetical protein